MAKPYTGTDSPSCYTINNLLAAYRCLGLLRHIIRTPLSWDVASRGSSAALACDQACRDVEIHLVG